MPKMRRRKVLTLSREEALRRACVKLQGPESIPLSPSGLYFVRSESKRKKCSRGFDWSGDRQGGMATFRCVGQLSPLSLFFLVALHVFGAIGQGSGSRNQSSSHGTYNTALVAKRGAVRWRWHLTIGSMYQPRTELHHIDTDTVMFTTNPKMWFSNDQVCPLDQ